MPNYHAVGKKANNLTLICAFVVVPTIMQEYKMQLLSRLNLFDHVLNFECLLIIHSRSKVDIELFLKKNLVCLQVIPCPSMQLRGLVRFFSVHSRTSILFFQSLLWCVDLTSVTSTELLHPVCHLGHRNNLTLQSLFFF